MVRKPLREGVLGELDPIRAVDVVDHRDRCGFPRMSAGYRFGGGLKTSLNSADDSWKPVTELRAPRLAPSSSRSSSKLLVTFSDPIDAWGPMVRRGT